MHRLVGWYRYVVCIHPLICFYFCGWRLAVDVNVGGVLVWILVRIWDRIRKKMGWSWWGVWGLVVVVIEKGARD